MDHLFYLASVIGQFEGIAQLYERGLVTPEHALVQFLRIVHDHQNEQAKKKAS